MATVDLYDPDFPHGSRAGYEKGCRGAACPNHLDPDVLSCKEAWNLTQGDYQYHNTPADQPVPRPKPEPVSVRPAPVKPAAAPTPASAPSKPAPPSQATPPVSATLPAHGTTARFSRGCKDERQCPNYGTSTRTCRQAVRDYQREYQRKKTAVTTSTEKPATETPTIRPAEGGNVDARQIHGVEPAEVEKVIPLAQVVRTGGETPSSIAVPILAAALAVEVPEGSAVTIRVEQDGLPDVILTIRR